MATSPPSLLPPNATLLERALDAAGARMSEVPVPIAELWNPVTCPPELLAWLAWGLSVDRWDAAWPEATKRAAVAASISLHRHKGTAAAIDAVLASFDELLELVEWHQMSPRGAPHTHDIVLSMVTAPGVAPGGPRSSAAFAEEIIREVTRTKRCSQHFRMVQQITLRASIAIVAAARFGIFARIEATVAPNTDPAWLTYLQTEDGEPMRTEDSLFMEIV